MRCLPAGRRRAARASSCSASRGARPAPRLGHGSAHPRGTRPEIPVFPGIRSGWPRDDVQSFRLLRKAAAGSMKTCEIGRAPSAARPAALRAPAETPQERDGASLEGSAAAIYEAGPDAYEATRANAGQPLHARRLDCAVNNGSGRGLSQFTAHSRIESGWPPCSSRDGPEGSYPGPVECAGSFKTLQRTGGLAPSEDAGERVYGLAFPDRQPRFANQQLQYRFRELSGGPEATPAPASSHLGSEASAIPRPACESSSGGRMKDSCRTEPDRHPGY